jgi:hypothetical protein
MLADAGKRLVGVRQRQKIVEIDAVMARPGEMLREARGSIALHQSLKPCEVLPVERGTAANGKPDAVQRHGITFADGSEIMMRRPALAHVVLGMDLEPADIG